MAQCPQCADSPLVHAMLTENLAAHACGKCLGTLVSLVAYRAWRESVAGRGARRDTAAAIPDVDAPDSVGAKKCPKCRSIMSKYRVTAEKSNRLDYCPHCEEIWLDEGEWQLVEGLVISGEFARVFTQSWQYAVRSHITDAMEEQRLRESLGADYERVLQFAQWLQQQPARQEILAVLAELPRGSRPNFQAQASQRKTPP
jgi:Zn-finger nucleic acid-binding protein